MVFLWFVNVVNSGDQRVDDRINGGDLSDRGGYNDWQVILTSL